MPILLSDKILHRPYERAVERVVGFIAKDLGYTDLHLDGPQTLRGGERPPAENVRRLDGDQISMMRYQYNRAAETRAELQRKLSGNRRRMRLSPANDVFPQRDVVLRKLIGLLDAHPFAQKSSVRGALRDAANYGVGRRVGDDIFALQKAAGLFVRERRVATLATIVTGITLKLAIVYGYAKNPKAKSATGA